MAAAGLFASFLRLLLFLVYMTVMVLGTAGLIKRPSCVFPRYPEVSCQIVVGFGGSVNVLEMCVVDQKFRWTGMSLGDSSLRV